MRRQAQKKPGGGNLEITPSDLATIVTVNEARVSSGLPALRRPDGSSDPDGDLTIAEFKAKHSGVVAEASAASEGQPVDGPASLPPAG